MPIFAIDRTEMHYRRKLSFAGSVCELSTNSQVLVGTLHASSGATNETCNSAFTMQVLVNEYGSTVGQPHFRGLRHIVIASFGNSNVFVFDLLRRNVSAAVSEAIARDIQFWSEKMLPITLGVLGAAIGLMPMHCACLAWEGNGLLVAGASGAGKSTLSVALTQYGFDYVSDDWTYMSEKRGRLVAHGTSAPVKLLPDAVQHFRALSHRTLQTSMNGELAYEVDAGGTFGARVVHDCEPRWLVFLEGDLDQFFKSTANKECEAQSS
ncbi:MAG: hypothetical protein ACYCOR_16680 [Acidobacteriaceae bacterium]